MSGIRLLALVVGVIFLGGGLSALLGALDLLPAGAVAGQRPKGLQYAMAAIGMPVGAILLAFVARAQARLNRLASHGIAVEATVVEIAKLPYAVNRQPRWQLAYAFSDGKGGAHTATTTLADRTVAEALKPGHRLAVRHVPDDPADNIITDFKPRPRGA
jgi:hypothetical protein